MSKKDTLREMDHTANKAHEELIENFEHWSAGDAARWWPVGTCAPATNDLVDYWLKSDRERDGN